MNEIVFNQIGLELLNDSDGNRIIGNIVFFNETGYFEDGTGSGNNNVIEDNQIAQGSGVSTGLHISNASPIIRGNLIAGDAGDGIALENDADPVIEGNSIFDNQGFGVNNTSGGVIADARGNWWGHPSGPGGAGPGLGDEVSAGVDFADWRTQAVSLVVSFAVDSIFVPPAGDDSVAAFCHNWEDSTDIVDVTVGDDKGWVTTPASFTKTLADGGTTTVRVTVPFGVAGGEADVVRIEVTSQNDPSATDADSFVVVAYEPMLERIVVSPDSVDVAPGDTVRFAATGLDQFGNVIAIAPSWSATGGSIDAAGVYVAGSTEGDFQVTVGDGAGIEANANVRIVDPTGGAGPLSLVVGILQNPYLTQFIDIYVVASDAVDPEALTVTVGGAVVGMSLVDASENLWRGDHELAGAGGAIALDVCAASLAGVEACYSTTVSAQRVAARRAVTLWSADGAFAIEIPSGAVQRDGYMLVIPATATVPDPQQIEESLVARVSGVSEVAAFEVSPRPLVGLDPMTAEFHYRRAGVAEGIDPTRLFIAHDGARDAYVDVAAGVVRATVTGLGAYRLVIGVPGSSRLADPRFARLDQNFPNPFNPSTTIRFEVQTAQEVRIDVYDVAGRLVASLVEGVVTAGAHRVEWNGRSRHGDPVSSGVYFLRLKTRHTTATRKMVMIR